MKQSFEKSNQICLLFSSISLLPSIILGCFFLLGFANQFNYLSKFSNDINLLFSDYDEIEAKYGDSYDVNEDDLESGENLSDWRPY